MKIQTPVSTRALFIADVVKNMKNKKITNKQAGKVKLVDANRFIQTIDPDRNLFITGIGGDALVFAQYDGYVDLYALNGSGPNSAMDVCEIHDLFNRTNITKIGTAELLSGIEDQKTDREKRKEDSQKIYNTMKASYHKGMASSGTIKRRDAIDNKMSAHIEWVKRGDAGRMKWSEQRSMLCLQFLAILELIKYCVDGGGYYVTNEDDKGIRTDVFVPFDKSDKVVFDNLVMVANALKVHMIWKEDKEIDNQNIRRLASCILRTVGSRCGLFDMARGHFKTFNAQIDNKLETDGVYGAMEVLVKLINTMNNHGSTFRVEYKDDLCDNADLVDDMNPQELYELGYVMENELPSRGEKVTDEMVEILYYIARCRAEKEIEQDNADRKAVWDAGLVAMDLLNIA